MKLWLVLFLCGAAARGQANGGAVQFHFARPGLAVSEYTLRVAESGAVTYTAKGLAKNTSSNRYAMAAPDGPIETVQEGTLGREMTGRLFALARQTKGLQGCASKAKGIADTGSKELVIREGSGAQVSCSFNFSESKPVVELTNTFEAMAYTLDEARKLEGEQRFDRLGLDGEMAALVDAVKEGRAKGLSVVQGVLQGLVDDPAVLERVRAQAAKLLQQSVVEK